MSKDESFFFFFSSRRRHTRLQGDWSSDVCSSDLAYVVALLERTAHRIVQAERVLAGRRPRHRRDRSESDQKQRDESVPRGPAHDSPRLISSSILPVAPARRRARSALVCQRPWRSRVRGYQKRNPTPNVARSIQIGSAFPLWDRPVALLEGNATNSRKSARRPQRTLRPKSAPVPKL